MPALVFVRALQIHNGLGALFGLVLYACYYKSTEKNGASGGRIVRSWHWSNNRPREREPAQGTELVDSRSYPTYKIIYIKIRVRSNFIHLRMYTQWII
jgi:hypothetical protein